MKIAYISLFYRALTLMKARLKGAQKGHSLLKKKSDALTMRFRKILKQIIDVRTEKTRKISRYAIFNILLNFFSSIDQNFYG